MKNRHLKHIEIIDMKKHCNQNGIPFIVLLDRNKESVKAELQPNG